MATIEPTGAKPIEKRAAASLREQLAELSRITRLTLSSVAIPLAAGIALCALAQGLEALRTITEADPERTASAIGYGICIVIASVMTWYCARVTLYLFANETPVPAAQSRPKWPERELPRIWGTIPALSAAVGFSLLTGLQHESAEPAPFGAFAIGSVGLAVLLYLAFVARRVVINRMAGRTPDAEVHAPQLASRKSGRRVSVTDLPLQSWGPLLAVAVLTAALCAWIVWWHGLLPSAIPTPAILMLAVAGWVTFMTWVTYESRRHGLHIVRGLALAVLLFSAFNINDNHRVREERHKAAEQVRPPASAPTAIEAWLRNRPDLDRYPAGYPVFIVAAEGGGIRAALTTALILGYITDRCPAFPLHTLAISGVSGGSVGSAAYVATAKRHLYANAAPPCALAVDTADSEAQELASFLDHDFLTPTLAVGLYPDLLARLLPVPWNQADRARGLELALSREYDRTLPPGPDRIPTLEHSFLGNTSDSLFHWDSTARVPALVLNTTRVETGEPVLVTQLLLGHGAPGGVSLYGIDSVLDIPLSTAAGLSARFPIVSPHGLIVPRARVDSEPRQFRLVDGGYYDNSGLATAMSIAALVQQLARQHALNVIPVILRTGFKVDTVGRGRARWGSQSQAEPWAEFLSPVRAVLNARDAHTAEEIASLYRWADTLAKTDPGPGVSQAGAGSRGSLSRTRIAPVQLLLVQDSVTYVLGWLMSPGAVTAATNALRPPVSCVTRSAGPSPPGPFVRGLRKSPTNDDEYCRVFEMLSPVGAADHR
jgi:hypothetical protein